MKRNLMALLAASLLAMSMTSVAAAKDSKAAICHYNPATDSYELLMVTWHGKAVEKHLAHGDARTGDAVPTMPGYTFDASCRAAMDLIVAWTDMNGNGTYEADTDIVINKLIDGPGAAEDGIPGVGDLPIYHMYPLNFAATEFGGFGPRIENPITSVFYLGAGMVGLVEAYNFYWWQSTSDLEEFYAVGGIEANIFDGPYVLFQDYVGQTLDDVIEVSDDWPDGRTPAGDPEIKDFSVTQSDPANNAFISVATYY